MADAYDLAIDSVTFLGNSAFEFSMKRREMLKSNAKVQFNANYLTKCISRETRKNVFQWRLENCWERVR